MLSKEKYVLGAVTVRQGQGTCAPLSCNFTSFLLSPNAGLTTQKLEGGSYPPELPGAHGVCFLTSGSTLELLEEDVDTELSTVQERSPGTKVAG